MKKNLARVAIAFILCAMTGVVAFAKEKSRVVTFGSDFVVGGTEVKAGTYKVTFNDETNEVSILDRKTKSVLAKAAARLEERQNSTGSFDMRWATNGNRQVLIGITFPGARQNIIVNESGTQVADSK
jgi:hypothetical protein